MQIQVAPYIALIIQLISLKTSVGKIRLKYTSSYSLSNSKYKNFTSQVYLDKQNLKVVHEEAKLLVWGISLTYFVLKFGLKLIVLFKTQKEGSSWAWITYRENGVLLENNNALKKQVQEFNTPNDTKKVLHKSDQVLVKEAQKFDQYNQNTLHFGGINQKLTYNSAGQVRLRAGGVLQGWICEGGRLRTKYDIFIFINGHLIASLQPNETIVNQKIMEQCAQKDFGQAAEDTQIQQQVLSAKIGFKFQLSQVVQAQVQIRILAQKQGTKDYFELANSPLVYYGFSKLPSLERIIDKKEELSAQRNIQFLNIQYQLNNQENNSLYLKQLESLNNYTNLSMYKHVQDYKDLKRLAFIGVTADNIVTRQQLRQAWFPTKEYRNNLLNIHGIEFKFLASPRSLQHSHGEIEDDVILINLPDKYRSSQLAKWYFSQILDQVQAKIYFKVDQGIVVNVPQFLAYLKSLDEGDYYMGCFKSGIVYQDYGSKWYEPDYWRFGANNDTLKQYIQHAEADFYGISYNIAKYISLNNPILHNYHFEDVQMGAWLFGLNVNYIDNRQFCCHTLNCTVEDHNCIGIKRDNTNRDPQWNYAKCIFENPKYFDLIKNIERQKKIYK